MMHSSETVNKKSEFVKNKYHHDDIRYPQKLHQFIDTIEDKKVTAIYTLLEDEMNTDVQRKKLVFAEREKYLNGEGKSYSWNEVRKIATGKVKRHGL